MIDSSRIQYTDTDQMSSTKSELAVTLVPQENDSKTNDVSCVTLKDYSLGGIPVI